MQTFKLGTEVLVARPFGMDCTDLDFNVNLAEYLIPANHNVGWKDLASLISGDKVLLYDDNKKEFLFKEIERPDIYKCDADYITLGGKTASGGSGFSTSVEAYKSCSEYTPCMYTYENDDRIYLCPALNLYSLLRSAFFSPQGVKPRRIFIKALVQDVDNYNPVLDIRNVELDYDLCKVWNNTSLSVNIDLDCSEILLTRYKGKTMF